jgi:UDP-N-acetylmuramoyl-L-alanyl-D-glutamate--2,6-diaminopimelate ligase
MTMPGRFTIQALLARMVSEGCTHCIVETTSEGILQYRHVGVYYDIAVFTNLTPEHLPSHGGSFEHYKKTKGTMFAALGSAHKIIAGKRVEKVIIANTDDLHSEFYLSYKADRKITFGIDSSAEIRATSIKESDTGVTFAVDGTPFSIRILGRFNVYNALPAIIIGHISGMNDSIIRNGLMGLEVIPGRMEQINEGQPYTVIVDYAHEKQSMTNVLNTAKQMRKPGARTIILLGAEGGGRDKSKRPIMGELSARLADYVIVTNVDPYEDDPQEILEDIATVAEKFGKKRGTDLFVIEDRREGIRKALSLAQAGDVVLITGKGAEQSIVIGGVRSAWDDRKVVREELRKI